MADPIAWTFAAGGDYTEELAWLTDVLKAPTGGTQHRRLRQSPRTTLGFSALESGANRRWMDVLLRANSAGRWWVPVSIDARALGAAAAANDDTLAVEVAGARFAVGGHVLVVGTDPRRYEIREIAAIGADSLALAEGLASAWPAGTQLLPVRAGRLSDMPQVGRFTADDSALVSLQFRLEDPLDTEASLPGAVYRGYSVFDTFAPVWTSDPVWVPERQTDVQDDDIATPFIADTAGIALGKTTMQYAIDGAAAIAAFRGALFALAGRWTPVWVPSWVHDLRLAAAAGAGQSYIDVEGPLLSTPAGTIQANRRDIRIELFNGTVLYRRITAVAVQSSTVDRLTLDTAMPSAFTVAQVKMISFLTLSVQDSDTNSLRYFDAHTVQCELTWRELAHGL